MTRSKYTQRAAELVFEVLCDFFASQRLRGKKSRGTRLDGSHKLSKYHKNKNKNNVTTNI